MAILNNSNAISTAGGYDINNSLRFRSSASAYLNRTFATGSGTISTFSAWVKRGTLGSVSPIMFVSPNGTEDAGLQFDGNNNLSFSSWNGAGGRPLGQLITTQVFRDPSAWYHIVLAIDTTQATSSNRLKLYVNGSQVTAFGTATYPSQNATHYWNLAYEHRLGRYAAAAGTNYIDGYMAEVNFIGGSAKTPSDFGETDTTTGVWKPKAYTGTYGTNGFYLKFSDIATTSGSNAGLGKDFSGNTNYWTTNNISVTAGTTYDAMKDVPTNTSATVANYCVLNPLDKASTVTNGNLTSSGGASHLSVRSTIQIPTTGLWYGEAIVTTTTTGSIAAAFGVMLSTASLTSAASVATGAWNLYASANKIINNNGSSTTFGTGFTAGDVIQIAVDTNNNRAWFGVNNVWYNNAGGTTGNPSAGTNPTVTSLPTGLFAFVSTYDNTINANFGQRPFSYTPPTGFVALNTFNLPTPTILQGNKYMDATLWTGNGTSQTITNAGAFRPDLVWIKQRSSTEQHQAMDSVRGSSKVLNPNLTNAESTDATKLTSFNSNGFSVGSELAVNRSGFTYVGWQWQAGQGTNTTNTAGSITSTVSVNTTAGFSVVTYTGNGTSGATVGHGLGVAPSLILPKVRSRSGDSWHSYHSALGGTKGIILNTTDAATTDSGFWNNTNPTSTVFTVGTYNTFSGQTYVAYCWSEISGYSKFTSYTGNGSANGPFVYLGFRPKFVMIKRTDTTGNWEMHDTSRATYNVDMPRLWANLSSAEDATEARLDELSNGFKVRTAAGDMNVSSGTYIVAAWAENPFKNSNAR